jgi:hypothetical protein
MPEVGADNTRTPEVLEWIQMVQDVTKSNKELVSVLFDKMHLMLRDTEAIRKSDVDEDVEKPPRAVTCGYSKMLYEVYLDLSGQNTILSDILRKYQG